MEDRSIMFKTFNDLCKKIKNKKGLVVDKEIERAYYYAYELSTTIAIANAKKRSGVRFNPIDVEFFGSELYISLKKYFDPTKPPHDLSSYVNKIINNMLADLINKRIKEKQTREEVEKNYKNDLIYNMRNNHALGEKLIIVKESIKKLPIRCQKIIGFVSHKFKISEIIKSLELDISEDAMRQRVRECRKNLGRLAGGYDE